MRTPRSPKTPTSTKLQTIVSWKPRSREAHCRVESELNASLLAGEVTGLAVKGAGAALVGVGQVNVAAIAAGPERVAAAEIHAVVVGLESAELEVGVLEAGDVVAVTDLVGHVVADGGLPAVEVGVALPHLGGSGAGEALTGGVPVGNVADEANGGIDGARSQVAQHGAAHGGAGGNHNDGNCALLNGLFGSEIDGDLRVGGDAVPLDDLGGIDGPGLVALGHSDVEGLSANRGHGGSAGNGGGGNEGSGETHFGCLVGLV
ncbi:hypothetical protein MPH_12468 [Macrophomina phaseolina MS6]|uniref:Uncharacterized protein n=1 Tax=Macrophomina phaseolina (strain MS6) TaxID=1126212 RepID=K2RJQ2_MACPH|nr:hypothetical protein MPH_12468 [Macrophomina phaseolina MS6]